MSEIVFLGSKRSGLNALTILTEVLSGGVDRVITFDDRADARSCFDELHAFCASRGLTIQVITPRQLESELGAMPPAKIFVVGWYSLLSDALLGMHDFFGLHYSRLPRYRGNAPVVWQIINGEPEIGVTLFKFASGMDDGDYVGQGTFPLLESDDVASALGKADLLAGDLLRRHAPGIVDASAQLIAQDDSEATYCSLRTPEDGQIDWTWRARDIVNFVRAQTSPYPGAYVQRDSGEKIIIRQAALETRTIYAPVGGVFERRSDFVVIKCGDTAVRVLSAEMDGDSNLLRIFRSLKDRFRPALGRQKEAL